MGDRDKKVFSIPSVSEIKKANKISSSDNEPSLFKSSRSTAKNERKATSEPSSKLHHHDSEIRTADQSAARRPQHHAIPSDIQPVQKDRTHHKSFTAGTTHLRSSHVSTTQQTRDNVASKTNIQGGTETPLVESGFIPSSSAATVKQGEKTAVKTNDASTSSKSVSNSGDSTNANGGGTGYRPHAILANAVQKQNPVIKYIRNVPWELANIVPDFELGRTTCALFLSVRYHALHPNYIHERLKELGKQYELRVLLVLVDTSESQKVLQELAKIALLADLTLILAWSYEEAARYLETYKAYENKPPDLLMERVDSDFSSRVTDSLTTIKKVNKTDAATLLGTFKTMEKLIMSSKEELTLCPGLGPQKAQRLHDLFHEPFRKSKKPKLDVDDTH